jgi:oxalate decarboxylase/phosphoglucose isomerase-like protein (cupin superfamily)
MGILAAGSGSEGQMANIQIFELPNREDARGLSFAAPAEALAFVGHLGDVHFASTKPGSVRGNHYHLRRKEASIVLPGCKWSLHWAEGPDAEVESREFAGSAAVLVLIEPQTPHAMRNDGEGELWLFAIQSETNDPSDWVPRKLV